MKVYMCADCGMKFNEGFVPSECPNCGCPSEYFKVTNDTSSEQYITVCPDCGKTWDGLFPSVCDNCGCPSENFIKQEILHNVRSMKTPQKKNYAIINGVLFGVMVFICGFIIYNHYYQHEESSSYYEQTSSPASSYQNRQSKSIDDYDDIRQQLQVCEQKKQKFLKEVDKITYKASMAQYQGILAQKLFWDANDALDDFDREGIKLERLLRKHGFTDIADQHKRDREYLYQVYHEEKRKVQGYR